MSRKHNPIVALVALILMILLVLACTGCEEASAAEASAAEPARFIVEDVAEKGANFSIDLYIITDTETGVQYLYVDDYNAGGLTVLQPAPDREEAE